MHLHFISCEIYFVGLVKGKDLLGERVHIMVGPLHHLKNVIPKDGDRLTWQPLTHFQLSQPSVLVLNTPESLIPLTTKELERTYVFRGHCQLCVLVCTRRLEKKVWSCQAQSRKLEIYTFKMSFPSYDSGLTQGTYLQQLCLGNLRN